MKIRLEIDECADYEAVEIIIKCPKIDSHLEKIIQVINQNKMPITGILDGSNFKLNINHLFYIESVDNQTFLYDEGLVYENDLKLYELEERLKETSFIRISKHIILNTSYVESVKALFNGRFEATLTNQEKVIVNRHYVKAFKQKMLM